MSEKMIISFFNMIFCFPYSNSSHLVCFPCFCHMIPKTCAKINHRIQSIKSVKMYQYKICLASITIAVVSLGMILNRLYFAMIVLAAFACWFLTNLFIPRLSQYMLKAQVFGYDINKKGSEQGQKKIPQCIGFASAISFVIVLYFYFPNGYTSPTETTDNSLQIHYACLITILSTVLLGFADDMIDLAWRYKLIFPFLFMIPVIRAYDGPTTISIPYPLSLMLPAILDLGFLFYLYIILLGIFFTNAINIYAGINGLQVGQSIIAGCSQLVLFTIRAFLTQTHTIPTYSQKYEYSSFLLLCFLGNLIITAGTALAIMKYNAYPSQVFVGDTFCYFSGIVLALSAIFGGISICVHFLFVPQLVNFLYSVPQLFGFVPCPRHRLTVYDKKQDTLTGIKTNMNLLNLTLRIIGPTNEGVLCEKLLIFQILCSAVGIVIGSIWI